MLVLVLLSAFFSMSETVFSSVSTVRLKMYVEDRVAGAKKALSVAENFEKTLSTLLIGNNIVNIALATLSVGFFTSLIPGSNLIEVLSTVVVTVVVLIFGEIVPKTLAKLYSEQIALKIGFIVYVLGIILYPLSALFMLLQRGISRRNDKPSVDEAELEAILDTMEEEGSIKSDELEMIKNIFDLNDHTVEDIMVPRIDILGIDIETPIEEVKEIILENQYSRVPVYQEDKDHIVGILYERDFFSCFVRDQKINLQDILRPVKYVSRAMKVGALIHELQKSKTHIAIVSGEYGDTLGLVTMEDCLEELVGEIYDEHDEEASDTKLINKVGEDTYLVDGEIYVDDLFDELNIGQAPEVSTKLSSWVFESSETIPEVGYKLVYISNYTIKNEDDDQYTDYSKKITFEVVEVDERRIEKIKVTLVDATPEETEQSLKEQKE